MKSTAQRIAALMKLTEVAKDAGCTAVEPILARDIVVDPRVRLKCRLNTCGQFGRNLMCPPHAWELSETSEALARYAFALLIQITFPAADNECRAVFDREKLTINNTIVSLEREAFRLGFSLTVGLGSGHCQLCPVCAGDAGTERCRQPERARPSLEAVGIDVEKTCAAAGIPSGFVPGQVSVTGLLLLD